MTEEHPLGSFHASVHETTPFNYLSPSITCTIVPADVQEGSRSSMPVRARIVVSGRVQGVGYRAFAEGAAQQRGLRGGVRNLRDGRVEVEAEGDRGAIDDLLMCLRMGPPRAHIEDVHVQWETPTGLSAGFHIWY
jgi:acylphosphatase